jgi:hypothetical protein
VKTSSGRVGPGPNYFSDGTNNVWLDAQGRLHLRIVKTGNRWTCAEVIAADSPGYGTYRFYLDSPVDSLDPNAVLGLFTWNDDPAYNHRELDIEFSRWGSRNNQNAQYVVQPYDTPGNLYRFNLPAGFASTLHWFTWAASSLYLESDSGATILQKHQFGSGIPLPGGENARMNLWLYQGRQPTNRQPVEVIVNRFEYAP